MTDTQRWLEGVRVLDFTQYLAGPSCTRLLTELGADVIKVEQPPHGDPSRSGSPRINRRSGAHVQQNRGKRSLCVDLGRPEGTALIRELVPHVDVVVENFSPGVMTRRGLGYETLSEIKPGLIMASVSGFGQSGPLSARPAFDIIAQAYAGIMHMTGEPDGPPMFVGVGMGDTNAGVHAFAAIGHALFHRERSGRGTHLDISMVDALFHMHEACVHAVSMTHGEYVPMREGRHYQPISPAGTFRGPEGWIVICCAQDQIDSLWRAMDRTDLIDDPRFARNRKRLENRDELTAIIEGWMATFDTDAGVIDRLAEARVPCAPVLSPADAMTEPHLRARGTVRDVEDPRVGRISVPGFPIKSTDPLPDRELIAPALGEHNRQVLGELLGWDEDAIATYETDGILASKDR
jgi:crotonobetainyl-CoA:carnitine CoA-transferase CaiB-like acyl-CoA transferase